MNERTDKKGSASRNQKKGNSQRYRKNSNTRNRKFNGNTSSCEKKETSQPAYNDVAWYTKNPQMVKDAASITTSNVSGYSIRYTNTNNEVYSGVSAVTPGILALEYIPTISNYFWDAPDRSTSSVADETSVINLAAKNVYSFIRHANSGRTNYDSSDLMGAIIAATNAFAAIGNAVRAYGIAMQYSQRNRYMPNALLSAMGFSPSSVINNLNDFRSRINTLIAQASVIWIPSNMSVLARQFWLCSNVYTDSESDKSQFYLFRPSVFYKWDPTFEEPNSLGDSYLLTSAAIPYSNGVITYDAYCNYVQNLLAPIISDESLGIMFGDMLKAYGAGNLFTLQQIPENYSVRPVHNAEVLSQIHNSTAINVGASHIKQDKYSTIYQPYGQVVGKTNPSGPSDNVLLNFWRNDPTPEEVMVATRMNSLARDRRSYNFSGQEQDYCSVEAGTEYIIRYRLYYYDGNMLVSHNLTTYNEITSGVALEQFMNDISLVSTFDWAPVMYGVSYDSASKKSTITRRFIDLDNYTIENVAWLERCHKTAVFSEYNVPLVV